MIQSSIIKGLLIPLLKNHNMVAIHRIDERIQFNTLEVSMENMRNKVHAILIIPITRNASAHMHACLY